MTDAPQDVFRTHANYIRAFSLLASSGAFTRSDAYSRLLIRAEPTLPAKANLTADLRSVRRVIENGWGTELLMALGAAIIDEDELIRLSSNWSAVQCYYTAYHATQALALAKGFVRPDSHSKTQRMFADFWALRPLDLAPWSLAADSTGLRNVPASVTIDEKIHPWVGCTSATCWSLACKALLTTREDFLTEGRRRQREAKRTAAAKAWKEEEQNRLAAGRRPRKTPSFPLPLLSGSEKTTVDTRTRASTLIDNLYRVRIKTNYEDSAMFTDGPEDKAVSDEIRDDLCMIAGTTLLLHELHVAELVGRDVLRQWAEEWTNTKLPAGFTGGLAERIDILAR